MNSIRLTMRMGALVMKATFCEQGLVRSKLAAVTVTGCRLVPVICVSA